MDRHNVDADGVERADDDARKNSTDQNCTETLFLSLNKMSVEYSLWVVTQ
jgi:hypothetical protein